MTFAQKLLMIIGIIFMICGIVISNVFDEK